MIVWLPCFLLLIPLISSLILNGDLVDRRTAPHWMVTFHTNTQHEFNCGGTLIGPRIIHTAGHCLKRAKKAENHFVVTLNDFLADTKEKTDIVRTGSDWYLRSKEHSENEKQDDYGIIFLDEAVHVCDDHVESLEVPLIIDSSIFADETAVFTPATERCYMTGWGMNEKGRYEAPMRKAMLRKMHASRGMIIALKYDRDARACNGDSGSPMVCDVNGIPVMMGNVAGGIASDPDAVMNAPTDYDKCDLRRDVYSYINRQMPQLEQEIRNRSMWGEFVEAQKRF